MPTQFSLGDGLALRNPNQKRKINREMFTIIAPRYQWITRILSFGQDRYWKKALIQAAPDLTAPLCLDLACGTGDISRLLAARYPASQVLGIDLCTAMLRLSQQHANPAHLHYILADMLFLPVADESLDMVTGGYALRNAPDLDALLLEIFRKLKPGGTALFLDFSRPVEPHRAARQAKLLKFWTRLWGIIFHGNADVYGYIAESLALFPNTDDLRERILKTGFKNFARQEYFGGFTAQISFQKI